MMGTRTERVRIWGEGSLIRMFDRPKPGDYGPYFVRYIQLMPEGDLVALLEKQMKETEAALSVWDEESSLYRYAEGKWSVKELVHHIADTERVMSYRLLRAARGDKTPLPGFDQDLFVANANTDAIPWAAILRNLAAVRESTLALLRTFDQAAWNGRGHVNDHDMTVLSLACIIYGHMLHHLHILQERYRRD